MSPACGSVQATTARYVDPPRPTPVPTTLLRSPALAPPHATWLRLRASFAACCLLMLASCSVATVTSAITPMMMSDASIAPPRGLRMMLSPYVRHEHGTGEQIRSLLGELED